jgi:hypothetical protein
MGKERKPPSPIAFMRLVFENGILLAIEIPVFLSAGWFLLMPGRLTMQKYNIFCFVMLT